MALLGARFARTAASVVRQRTNVRSVSTTAQGVVTKRATHIRLSNRPNFNQAPIGVRGMRGELISRRYFSEFTIGEIKPPVPGPGDKHPNTVFWVAVTALLSGGSTLAFIQHFLDKGVINPGTIHRVESQLDRLEEQNKLIDQLKNKIKKLEESRKISKLHVELQEVRETIEKMDFNIRSLENGLEAKHEEELQEREDSYKRKVEKMEAHSNDLIQRMEEEQAKFKQLSIKDREEMQQKHDKELKELGAEIIKIAKEAKLAKEEHDKDILLLESQYKEKLEMELKGLQRVINLKNVKLEGLLDVLRAIESVPFDTSTSRSVRCLMSCLVKDAVSWDGNHLYGYNSTGRAELRHALEVVLQSSSVKVENLDLLGADLDPPLLDSLGNGLSKNNTVKVINIGRNNELTEDSIGRFVNALKTNTTLRTIKMPRQRWKSSTSEVLVKKITQLNSQRPEHQKIKVLT